MSTTTTTTTNVDVSENKEQSLAVVTNQTFLEEKEIQGLDDSAPSSSSSLSTTTSFDVTGTITLVSVDEKKFEISKKAAIQADLVKTAIEGDKEATEVPLPNITGEILELVVRYMNYHEDNPAAEIEKPLKSAVMTECVSEWDAEFIDKDDETVFNIILAANYMAIHSLLELACAKVASYVKGRNPEQIRQRFNIVNDFTPEEEEQARKENSWAEEQ